jgi:acetylglutamate kinase
VNHKLGFVGEVESVDPGPLVRVLLAGAMPVVAPIGLLSNEGKAQAQLLNINADAAAGSIATAIRAGWLAFLSDVPGVLGADGAVRPTLTADEMARLRADGVIEGGMIPKVDACLQAAAAGCRSVILDGRAEHSLISLIDGETIGTVVGGKN